MAPAAVPPRAAAGQAGAATSHEPLDEVVGLVAVAVAVAAIVIRGRCVVPAAMALLLVMLLLLLLALVLLAVTFGAPAAAAAQAEDTQVEEVDQIRPVTRKMLDREGLAVAVAVVAVVPAVARVAIDDGHDIGPAAPTAVMSLSGPMRADLLDPRTFMASVVTVVVIVAMIIMLGRWKLLSRMPLEFGAMWMRWRMAKVRRQGQPFPFSSHLQAMPFLVQTTSVILQEAVLSLPLPQVPLLRVVCHATTFRDACPVIRAMAAMLGFLGVDEGEAFSTGLVPGPGTTFLHLNGSSEEGQHGFDRLDCGGKTTARFFASDIPGKIVFVLGGMYVLGKGNKGKRMMYDEEAIWDSRWNDKHPVS